jgi:ABC-type glutathione transport system ATPase component
LKKTIENEKPDYVIMLGVAYGRRRVSLEKVALNLLNDLKRDFNLTYIFISHDLSVVKYMSDRMAVMKDGKIIEEGTHSELSNKDSGLYKDLWELQAGGFIQK